MRNLLGMPPRLLRWSARLLVLALSTGAVGPLLHGVHAEDCEPLFVVHDETAHHFQAASSTSTPLVAGEHCVACHFARSSRGPVSWEPSGLLRFATGTLLVHFERHLVALLLAASLSARAPPR
jgi:hypothetical protein